MKMLLVLCLYFSKNQQFQSYTLAEAHLALLPVMVNPLKKGTLLGNAALIAFLC